MKIIRQNKLRRLLGFGILKLFDWIENNNNVNFSKNGEKYLIIGLLWYYKRKRKPPIVFDIGANVGQYSEMILEVSKQIGIDVQLHLFEPTKPCYFELQRKFQKYNNVRINNFGISDKSGTAFIYYDQKKSGLASLYKRDTMYGNIKLNKKKKIVLKRLDSYLENYNIKKIDLLKIDVEGYEFSVLKSLGSYLKENFIDFIQFEYGGCNLDSHTNLRDFYKLFNSYNFVICKLLRRSLETRDYHPNFDNFRYCNYIAISKKLLSEL